MTVGASLDGGAALRRGEQLLSPSGRVRLLFDTSGHLRILDDGVETWAALPPVSAGADRLELQADGDLVLRGTAWTSGSGGFAAVTLVVLDNGTAEIRLPGGRRVWSTADGYVGGSLESGVTLGPGEYLRSNDPQLKVTMQADGDLVEARAGTVLWRSGTGGHPGASATMQADGDLVVTDPDGTVLWETGTGGFAGASFSVFELGRLLVMHGRRPVWRDDIGYSGDQLLPGWELYGGDYLLSADRRTRLLMGDDGTLTLSRDGAVGRQWTGGVAVAMREDGDLVLSRPGPLADVSLSQTAGHPGARLVVRDDGSASVTDTDGAALWQAP